MSRELSPSTTAWASVLTAPGSGKRKLRRKLSDSAIARMGWKAQRFYVPDGRGLGLAISPRGYRTWQLRTEIDGVRATINLGRWPEVSVRAARQKARSVRLAIAAGEDPRLTRQARARVTVAGFARRWMREVVARRRKNPAAVEKILQREVLPYLGAWSIAGVGFADVRRLVFRKRDAFKAAAAVQLRDLLWRMFQYAVTCGVVEQNPVAVLDRKFIAPLHPRRRSLSEAELRIFLRQLPHLGMPHAAALELLLLTLARKGELLHARWEHVDLDRGVWEVPPENSKSGFAHVVYLSNRAIHLFRVLAAAELHLDPRAFVLHHQSSRTQPQTASTVNKAIRRHRWGIPDFTPHDLRRTASTILNEQGYRGEVIEKALNHSVRGIRGVYNRAQYGEERKRMLAEWAEYLEGLANG